MMTSGNEVVLQSQSTMRYCRARPPPPPPPPEFACIKLDGLGRAEGMNKTFGFSGLLHGTINSILLRSARRDVPRFYSRACSLCACPRRSLYWSASSYAC